MSVVTLTVKRRTDKSYNTNRLARIDKETREKLGVKIGDPIRIEGEKNTAGLVEEALDKDIGQRVIRIDGFIRKSAGVKEGDKVRVRSVNVTVARKITLAPIDMTLHVDNDIINFVKRNSLIGRPFYEGNNLFVYMFGTPIPFEITETNPKRRAVIVNAVTSVRILRGPTEITQKLREARAKGVILGDRYELEELIGKGSYGQVWKAKDTSLERDIAIKLLHAGKKDFTQLRKEGTALSALSHENIVNVYDLGSDDKDGWSVTEFIDGESLQEHLSKFTLNNQWITLERAVVIIEKCLKALVYAHEKKRVHGDIKPSNILISNTGEIKLGDFGVAKILDQKRSDTTGYPSGYERMLGSSTYSAPEVLKGEPRDFQSDLFSVGILAYVLLSGKHPFMDNSGILSVPDLIISDTYVAPKLRELSDKIPESYEKIIHQLLEKNKKRRYETAQQVLSDWKTVKIHVKCPRCNTENSVSNNYCGKCGYKLELGQEKIHMEQLKGKDKLVKSWKMKDPKLKHAFFVELWERPDGTRYRKTRREPENDR